MKTRHRLSRVADAVTEAAGSVWAITAAFAAILLWALTGPIFDFSSNWQLVINTGTTIVTFLIVFAIQHTQNREAKATQLKLDELVRVTEAHNELIGVEQEDDKKLKRMRQERKK